MAYLLVFMFFLEGKQIGHVEMQVPSLDVCLSEKVKMEKKYRSASVTLQAECRERNPKLKKSEASIRV